MQILKVKDKECLELLTSRGLPSSHKESLPAFGLMVLDNDSSPIAMGYLRSIEGNMAMIDGLTTHLDKPATVRNEALDRLVSKLVKVAKVNNIKGLICFSHDINTLLRSSRHGFTLLPDQRVITLTL